MTADAFVEQMWAKHRTRVLGRLEIVCSALEDLAARRQPDRDPAAHEAHILAGALGMYGRPGSELLREVELALKEPGDADWSQLASRVRDVAAELAG